jgi:hypothetical protein
MLTSAQLRILTLQAQIDERTATRWLAGLPVKRGSAARLEAARVELGWGLVATIVPGGVRFVVTVPEGWTVAGAV